MGCLFLIGIALVGASFTHWPENWIALPMGVGMLWFVIDGYIPAKTSVYVKPHVTGARVRVDRNVWIGELDVQSSHSSHLTREMNLPTSSIINIVERNKSYTVQFALPPKTTPDTFEVTVYSPEGKASRNTIHYPQDRADKDYVTDVARANGYQGKIEMLCSTC